jgi:dienelactone hydrolase
VAPTGDIVYDVRDEVPPAVRDLLTADVPAGYAFPGTRDAPLADGSFPLVLFSHGYSGIRQQSSFLTSHLASWGMVVAAPEHASRDLEHVLAGTASGDGAASVADLLGTLDLMTTVTGGPTGTTGDRFAGHVDIARVGLVGHSAGGWTVVTAAADPRVAGYVSLASGAPRDGAPYPVKPSLFMAGAIDGVVPVGTVTRPAFDGAPAPSWFVELAATGHNGFDDFCTFGNGTGIIGIAEASGLGPVLDAQPQLRTLGEDGCIPPAAPVQQAFPVIRQATTSFLRNLFGEDPAVVLGVTDPTAVAVTADQH